MLLLHTGTRHLSVHVNSSCHGCHIYLQQQQKAQGKARYAWGRLTNHQCQMHQSEVAIAQAAGALSHPAKPFERPQVLVVQPAQHFVGLHRLVA